MKNLTVKFAVALLTFIIGSLLASSGLLRPVQNITPVSLEGNRRRLLPQLSVPAGWRRVEAKGKFIFYLPPDMKDSGRRSINSYYRSYDNGSLEMSFVHKPDAVIVYGKREEIFGKGFQEIATEIDGRKSIIFIYQRRDDEGATWYMADLYVGDLINMDVPLRMWISSKNPNDLMVARQIFNTIEFANP